MDRLSGVYDLAWVLQHLGTTWAANRSGLGGLGGDGNARCGFSSASLDGTSITRRQAANQGRAIEVDRIQGSRHELGNLRAGDSPAGQGFELGNSPLASFVQGLIARVVDLVIVFLLEAKGWDDLEYITRPRSKQAYPNLSCSEPHRSAARMI